MKKILWYEGRNSGSELRKLAKSEFEAAVWVGTFPTSTSDRE
ncbi:MAG: hypothetical protein ABSF63_02550 [Candidatus Bathyarchaeia archaeon]